MAASRTELPGGGFFRVEQVRALDAAAIAGAWPGRELMERAGLAAWRLLRQRWPEARRIALVLGAGNNAGDAWVLARWAHLHGCEVELQATVSAWSGSAGEVAALAQARGLSAAAISAQGLAAADVVVDAILGSGSRGAPRAEALAAIMAIRACTRPVLALDLPSGVDADRGGLLGSVAVQADCTLSFVAAKRGLYTGAAAAHAGQVWVDGLGIDLDPSITAAVQEASAALPLRARDAHKGDQGHVLVLGGNHGMSGAALLCARAAARGGAGRVSLISRPLTVQALPMLVPEIMTPPGGTDAELAAALQRADVCVLGPGLARDDWAQRLYAAVYASGRPCVLDADALRLLAAQPCAWPQAVITPHPGEAAALLGVDIATVQADRFAAAAELHRRYAATVVLKGNGSLIHGAAGTALCRAGNPGMASAGMGDVLAGLLAALRAQGLAAQPAAAAAVYMHARSGDRLAAQRGERGLLASDIIEAWQEDLNPCSADPGP